MTLDRMIIERRKPILKDVCVEQKTFQVCCGTDYQISNKYVKYKAFGVTIDLINYK